MISRLILCFLASFGWVLGQPMAPEAPPPLTPTSSGRARVVIVEDPRAVLAFTPSDERVDEMVRKGVMALTGRDEPCAAWRSLISTQDTIGIKVVSAPGATSGTRPMVAAAVAKGLLAAGVPPRQIVIWDKHIADLRLAGFVGIADRLGVQVAGSAEAGYDEKSSYESALLGKLVWGDLEFGRKGESVGRKSFVSKLLTQRLTRIINVTPLLNHNLAQVSGNLYTLALGSVDNTLRFEAVQNPVAQLSQTVPEIYALPEIGDRVALSIVDALICQYLGEERLLLHYSAMLNQLRFSTDPVALDILSIHELDRQRQKAKIPPVPLSWQIYNNAALLDLGVADPRLMDVFKVAPTQSE